MKKDRSEEECVRRLGAKNNRQTVLKYSCEVILPDFHSYLFRIKRKLHAESTKVKRNSEEENGMQNRGVR